MTTQANQIRPKALAVVASEVYQDELWQEEQWYLALESCAPEAGPDSIGVSMGAAEDYENGAQVGLTLSRDQAKVFADALINWINS